MKALIAVLLVLLVVLQSRLWFAPNGLRAVWDLEDEMSARAETNRQLEERNRSLEAEVEDLKSGLEAVEERARSEMGMIRQGEVFYQTIERAEVAGTAPAPAP